MNRAMKTVSFSPMSTMAVIEYPSPKEKNATWYSEKELGSFKIVLKSDVAKCSQMLNESRFGFLSQDDAVDALGLESFLNRGLTKHIFWMKKVHLHTVLNEQARQRYLSAYSVEELAHSSVISSTWSRKRSHLIAVMHLGCNATEDDL
ncbi:hypothetical protein HJC23_006574 [Cyclotella cryptica]|uniref:Uncharacterized protein n=1 Tax=Cyclotella cryptica TaxID=29204 RepID=A0ABD3PMJ0_9STRA|eukprot:CCRYP_013652-RA/>CCRYP_013652-RA protein AED:0.22 eAED:0.22 QI:0/-1/0/1/-1/1/1/0/147